jgi:hypothetical protein
VHGIRSFLGVGRVILLIVIERILQFLEFRRFDEWFGRRFFRFGEVFRLCLGFFVLGFG